MLRDHQPLPRGPSVDGRLPRAASAASDDGDDSALRRHLGWAHPWGGHGDARRRGRSGVRAIVPRSSAPLVLVAIVATVALLLRGFATRILERLDGEVERARNAADRAALPRARRSEEFRTLAYHDELTGLPNRSLLHDRLGVAITHARRQATRLALLFLDLDDFKTRERLLRARLR